MGGGSKGGGEAGGARTRGMTTPVVTEGVVGVVRTVTPRLVVSDAVLSLPMLTADICIDVTWLLGSLDGMTRSTVTLTLAAPRRSRM